ncbi:MAG: hypothetical protein GY909_08375 [Oligoflexia bacterium]|nr:hypothetical protein [Oligoflexia bacterium]
MNIKALVAAATISLSAGIAADYNGVIYIPTSVEYDVERDLMMNLQFLESDSRFVSYWNKDRFQKFCQSNRRVIESLNTEVEQISNKFLSESESFRHNGKVEINEAIKNLEKVVVKGLEDITVACRDQKRMKEDQARKLTGWGSKFDGIKTDFYQARNKLSNLIEGYGKVIRAYDQANTSFFAGKFEGHQGWKTGYKSCSVDIKVEDNKVKMNFKDSDSDYSMTRNLEDMSADKKELKNFKFDKDLKTSTICSAKGTTFAELSYDGGDLTDIVFTHRSLKRNATGFGVIISCISDKDSLLSKFRNNTYKCYDLKRKN